MIDEADTDIIVLQPGQPKNAVIGSIPEKEEQLFDTVFEESAA